MTMNEAILKKMFYLPKATASISLNLRSQSSESLTTVVKYNICKRDAGLNESENYGESFRAAGPNCL